MIEAMRALQLGSQSTLNSGLGYKGAGEVPFYGFMGNPGPVGSTHLELLVDNFAC